MSIQGFWGLQLIPGKTYTQVVSAPFRITMASLSAETEDNKRTSVSVLVEKKDFVLCTLVPNKIEQQPLDITFVEGEEVTFSTKGQNTVHLTGNYVFQDDEDEEMSGSMGESDEEEEGDDDMDNADIEEFIKNLPPMLQRKTLTRPCFKLWKPMKKLILMRSTLKMKMKMKKKKKKKKKKSPSS
ncbi:unnamed protein product [Rhizopus stolonifer]